MKELITVEKGYLNGLLHKEYLLELEEAKNRELRLENRELTRRLYVKMMSEGCAEELIELGNYDESVSPIE